MIRTHVIPCDLNKEKADALNQVSGHIYTTTLKFNWWYMQQHGKFLAQGIARKMLDPWHTKNKMHAHSIDAAQEGFYDACITTNAARKSGYKETNYPHREKKFRTTVWKNTAIRYEFGYLILSNGRGYETIRIDLPGRFGATKVLEARLVYDRIAQKYNWHIVAETGKKPKIASGNNIVSVDPGEIHPATVGDEHSSTVITCRERRAKQQGHAKAQRFFSQALSRKKKGSKRHKRLVRSKVRCKAKHQRVMRDIDHKISKVIVDEAVERNADTIVYGDIRNIADGINKGTEHNQRMSQWAHGKVRAYTEYKAEAVGVKVVLQSERYTSQTCPSCGNKHKPGGRNYKCRRCGFSGHRDVVGQVNILSAHKYGEPGKIQVNHKPKYRIAHNVRAMRKCSDTSQVQTCSS